MEVAILNIALKLFFYRQGPVLLCNCVPGNKKKGSETILCISEIDKRGISIVHNTVSRKLERYIYL